MITMESSVRLSHSKNRIAQQHLPANVAQADFWSNIPTLLERI
ncbi:MAG: hypothetical protein ACYCTY_16365 [Sulfuricella sp.]